MLIRKTVIVTAFAVFTAILVPAFSAAEVPGGLLDEEELGVVTDTGAVPIGEFPADKNVLVATEYQGNRIAVSANQQEDFSWTVTQTDEFAAARVLIGDDGAYGKRTASANMGANFLSLINRDGFSVLVEINSADSDSEYVFDIDLPDGSTLILTDEGSVDVLGNNRYTIGEFKAPWALDAAGNAVPTHFEVDSNTITQIVETEKTTVYPVVADPHFTWGWVTGTMYFNKTETLVLCSGSYATLQTLAIIPVWLPIVAAVAGVILAFACTARQLGKCLKVKSTGVVWFYSGGFCTWSD